MQINVETTIRAPVEAVWHAITDFEGAADRISAIDEIEILEKPDSGLVGLKWKETRTMFGKQATEVMWITGVNEGASYDVRAESNGMVYESRLSVTGQGDQALLRMTFGGEAQGLGADFPAQLVEQDLVGRCQHGHGELADLLSFADDELEASADDLMIDRLQTLLIVNRRSEKSLMRIVHFGHSNLYARLHHLR